jgi:hypothetical protein
MSHLGLRIQQILPKRLTTLLFKMVHDLLPPLSVFLWPRRVVCPKHCGLVAVIPAIIAGAVRYFQDCEQERLVPGVTNPSVRCREQFTQEKVKDLVLLVMAIDLF